MAGWLSRLFGKEKNKISEEDFGHDDPIHPKEPIPEFKYHPHPLDTITFEQEELVTCMCCSRLTQVYYEYPFESSLVSDDDDFILCPNCIKNGEASKKFQGKFQIPDFCEKVSDPEKLDELCHRTPGYYAPEKAYWLAHCDDFCALVALIDDWSEIEDRGIEEEIEADWVVNSDYKIEGIETIKDELNFDNENSFYGYLFCCLHCGKHRLYVDFDNADSDL